MQTDKLQENKMQQENHSEKEHNATLQQNENHDVTTEDSKLVVEEKENEQKNQVAELQNLVKELNNKLLLEIAENDNLRKRFARELDDTKKYAIANFAKELVEVLENLYRVTENISDNAEITPEMQSMSDGVLMTQKILLSAFEKHAIQRIYPEIESEFDHRYHQALSKQEDATKKKNTIAQVVQAGYIIDSRLLRPALVIVVG